MGLACSRCARRWNGGWREGRSIVQQDTTGGGAAAAAAAEHAAAAAAGSMCRSRTRTTAADPSAPGACGGRCGCCSRNSPCRCNSCKGGGREAREGWGSGRDGTGAFAARRRPTHADGAWNWWWLRLLLRHGARPLVSLAIRYFPDVAGRGRITVPLHPHATQPPSPPNIALPAPAASPTPASAAMIQQPRVPPTGQRQAIEVHIKWREVLDYKRELLRMFSLGTGLPVDKLDAVRGQEEGGGEGGGGGGRGGGGGGREGGREGGGSAGAHWAGKRWAEAAGERPRREWGWAGRRRQGRAGGKGWEA